MAVAFYRHYPTCPLGIGAAGSKGVANISFFFSFSHLVPFFFALSNPLDQLLAGCQPCWPSGFDRALATACTRGKNSLSLSLPLVGAHCFVYQSNGCRWRCLLPSQVLSLSSLPWALFILVLPGSHFVPYFSFILLLSYGWHKRIHHLVGAISLVETRASCWRSASWVSFLLVPTTMCHHPNGLCMQLSAGAGVSAFCSQRGRESSFQICMTLPFSHETLTIFQRVSKHKTANPNRSSSETNLLLC